MDGNELDSEKASCQLDHPFDGIAYDFSIVHDIYHLYSSIEDMYNEFELQFLLLQELLLKSN